MSQDLVNRLAEVSIEASVHGTKFTEDYLMGLLEQAFEQLNTTSTIKTMQQMEIDRLKAKVQIAHNEIRRLDEKLKVSKRTIDHLQNSLTNMIPAPNKFPYSGAWASVAENVTWVE